MGNPHVHKRSPHSSSARRQEHVPSPAEARSAMTVAYAFRQWHRRLATLSRGKTPMAHNNHDSLTPPPPPRTRFLHQLFQTLREVGSDSTSLRRHCRPQLSDLVPHRFLVPATWEIDDNFVQYSCRRHEVDAVLDRCACVAHFWTNGSLNDVKIDTTLCSKSVVIPTFV